MMAAGCGNDTTDNNNNTPQPIKFVSTDSAGSTYTLVITPGTANTVAKDDSYVLTISKSGQPDKVSKGTISNVAENGALTMKPGKGDTTFTVTVNNGQMTNITGTITVEEGESVSNPGTLTPGGSNNGNGGEVTNSTFTLTGIPAEYNGKYAGISGSVNAGGGTMVYGFESFNSQTGIATLCLISNGSVKIPMNAATSQTTFTKYTGNDTGNINVLVFGSSTVNFPSNDSSLALTTVGFSNVQFTNGGATRTWTGGGSSGSGSGWTAVNDSTFSTSSISTIAYGNNKFVAGDYNGKIATSPDGVTWTAALNVPFIGGSAGGIHGIVYGNGKFVGIGGGGSGNNTIIATSPDGVTWTAVTINNVFFAIVYANNKYVIGGTYGATSPDGTTWTASSNTTFNTSRILEIAYGNNKFVAVGGDGKMATSPDGTTWTAVSNTTFGTSSISAIAYGNNKFVAGGGGGKMAASPDGTTWTAVANSTFDTSNIRAIAYGNNKFVAVGQGGKMATSPDGTTWTAVSNTTFGTNDIQAITYGNNKFVAGGGGGKIAYLSDN
jgi:hypothetical protein